MKRARLFALLCAAVLVWALQAGCSRPPSKAETYVWPTDAAVLQKLHHWQDQKFGILLHWGLYSQVGKVESWELTDEDWINRGMPLEQYRRWYWGQIDSLNPTQLDPDQWARVIADAGARYAIFTTKHHDGFATYDSHYSDFTIAHGAFAGDERRDVARGVFDAFRRQGLMVGCYFSKPDWHCPWFWRPDLPAPNRRPNYDRAAHPEWWNNYVSYTQQQLGELMQGYGPFDILWLDGGWVKGGEIGLDTLITRYREWNPGMLAVDRIIGGPNENYLTPEHGIPATQLRVPWENCIPLSGSWGYNPNAEFKTAAEVIALLAEIVAKGGSLALGVGPTPQGLIQPEVAEILHQVGQWLRANGEAIYGTRCARLYNSGDTWFTQSADGESLYAIVTAANGGRVEWTGNVPAGHQVTLLATGERLPCRVSYGTVSLQLPQSLQLPVALKMKK